MDPQKCTSRLARQLFLQIAKNRIEIDLQTNHLLKLQREKRKLQIVQVFPFYKLLLNQIQQKASL